MSLWQQHYYTWSTKSLSQNKVGLGIVAVSKDDRDALLIADHYGAKSEVIREEGALVVERGSYSQELPGFIRTAATPCEQGADQRNNKFVHICSLKTDTLFYPEDYLAPIRYETEWNGQAKLTPLSVSVQLEGKNAAIAILKKYQLSGRLEELFYAVYHCLLAGERPLSIVDSQKNASKFQDFSREMMILIHHMLPMKLRKEADYVSFVREESQEAHFLFRKEGGKHTFDLHRPGRNAGFALLEKDFYKKLAEAFLAEDESFDKMMEDMDGVLCGLLDRRNQLEKCIFALMASRAGKEKAKEDFFVSMERLMYWARKDKSLIPAILDATKELDFHSMDEEELLAYSKLLLTGAGGETKSMVHKELNRMLQYYDDKKDRRFRLLLDYICTNHVNAYQQIMKVNRDGFAEKILFEPIDSKNKLSNALKIHKLFLEEESYRSHVIKSAYQLYQKSPKEALREEIADMAKSVDYAMFVTMKQKDVDGILKQAENLTEYLDVMKQISVDQMEEEIKRSILKRYLYLLKNENHLENLNVNEWIPFVLKLSATIEPFDKKKAKELIRSTKNAILKADDEVLLEKVNKNLESYGIQGISRQVNEPEPVKEADGKLCEDKNEKEEVVMEEKGIKKSLHFAVEDIMSKTFWAVLFGLYGFIFVTLREVMKYPTEYGLSIFVLVGLVILYAVMTLVKKKKEITPGGIVYILGVGIVLMNWGVALDTTMGVVILFAVSLVVSIGLKIFYYNYFLDEE